MSNCTIAASNPTPMVLLSLGHSGSSVTALRLANLTGSGPLGGERVTGSTLPSPGVSPGRLPTETPVHDIHAYFCKKQREATAGDVRSTRLVGFKWKPLLIDGAWDDAFRWLGDHREVRVVHLRRNPLDVMISGVKHGSSMCLPGADPTNPGPWREKTVPGASAVWQQQLPTSDDPPRRLIRYNPGRHCTTADMRNSSSYCRHNYWRKKVNLTVECVLPYLDANRADAENVAGKLKAYGATHESFSYFELFKAPEPQIVEAWRRLLPFLGVAAWEVSHGDVVGASDLVETTPSAQPRPSSTTRRWRRASRRPPTPTSSTDSDWFCLELFESNARRRAASRCEVPRRLWREL